ncbi:MAG: prolipoprotein diacylglyceryl transferase [Clostridia bacterium]|nr:prolipoprotein diacylglyceryl transferase [Clostridia bacterium]
MLKVSTLSFPGLGIGEFNVNSVAFTVFGVSVAWYGVIITCGIVLACLYVMYRAKQNAISTDDVLDLALIIVPVGIVCARLYYVVMKPELYNSFFDVINLRQGGLAIYGGIIGGGLAAWLVARHKKIDILLLLDMLAPAVMIGQILGRWGNFMNAEAYGGVTDLPWRMGIHTYGLVKYVHPTFLYESLWNLLGFILLNFLFKKKQYNGQIFFGYIVWYGLGRFFIEGLRADSLYLFGTGIRTSQLVALLCVLAGGGMLIYRAIKDNIKKKTEVTDDGNSN